MPQALLFLILMLMLTMLFLNIMLFTLAPQYVTYGSQHYMVSQLHHSLRLTLSVSRLSHKCKSSHLFYFYFFTSCAVFMGTAVFFWSKTNYLLGFRLFVSKLILNSNEKISLRTVAPKTSHIRIFLRL